MIHPDYLISSLEELYTRIQNERMAGIPVVNPALSVKAIGFQHWGSHCLGVLITPWFMNLMLLPCEGDDWQDLPIGAKKFHAFPSGSYEFIVGEDPEIGRYQMCSLFSPMFDFESQEQAIDTAEEVLQALMVEENKSEVSTKAKEIKETWLGSEEAGVESSGIEEQEREIEAPVVTEADIPKREPLSRRDLLRGSFLRGQE